MELTTWDRFVGWSTTALISYDGCWSLSGPADITGCPMNAVLWTASGQIIDLGTLPGDTFSSASKINFFGQVIGSSGNTVVFQWGAGDNWTLENLRSQSLAIHLFGPRAAE